jgi:hypothetical protein
VQVDQPLAQVLAVVQVGVDGVVVVEFPLKVVAAHLAREHVLEAVKEIARVLLLFWSGVRRVRKGDGVEEDPCVVTPEIVGGFG